MQGMIRPNLNQVSIGLFIHLLIIAPSVVISIISSSSLSSSLPTTIRMYATNRLRHSYSPHISGVLSKYRKQWSHNNLPSRIDSKRTRLHSTSKFSYRKERKEVAKKLGKNSKELDWEHYEFSQNPKNDHRFNKADFNSGQEEFDVQKETEEDKKVAKKLDEQQDAFFNLSPSSIDSAIKSLEPYINDDRLDRVRTVLGQRTKNCKFLFENPNNPSNVWACLRTIDSFGIQDVDVIIESGMYKGKQALSTKRGMRTAMGSAQWLSLRNHRSTAEAIKEIRDVQGYKIYASDLNPNSKDVRDIKWDDGPYCIVMGNEDRGISEEMRNLADETFTLPMCGFAESFNLSVATSITLAHMSAKSQNGKGPLLPGDMKEHEFNCLYLKGLLHSLPQRRTGQALLRQNNLLDVLEAFKTI